jgi:hypothetical protein
MTDEEIKKRNCYILRCSKCHRIEFAGDTVDGGPPPRPKAGQELLCLPGDEAKAALKDNWGSCTCQKACG